MKNISQKISKISDNINALKTTIKSGDKKTHEILNKNTRWTFWFGLIMTIIALSALVISLIALTDSFGEDRPDGLVQKTLEENLGGATHFYFYPHPVSSLQSEVEPNSPKTSKEFIIQKMAEQITECESQNRHLDRNGNLLVGDKHLKNPAFGIAQYQKRTFSYLSNLANRPDLRIENKQHQIWLLKWSLRNNLGHYWSCYKPYIEVKIN